MNTNHEIVSANLTKPVFPMLGWVEHEGGGWGKTTVPKGEQPM